MSDLRDRIAGIICRLWAEEAGEELDPECVAAPCEFKSAGCRCNGCTLTLMCDCPEHYSTSAESYATADAIMPLIRKAQHQAWEEGRHAGGHYRKLLGAEH